MTAHLRMGFFWLAMTLGSLVGLCADPITDKIKTSHHCVAYTERVGDFSQTMTIESWRSSDRFRLERTADGEKTVTIGMSNEIYRYIEGEKRGKKLTPKAYRALAHTSLRMEDPLRLMLWVRDQGKKIGTATVENTECDQYQLDEQAGMVTYVWLSHAAFLPVKITTQSADGRTALTFLYKTIEINPKIEDRLLTPPSDVVFEETSDSAP